MSRPRSDLVDIALALRAEGASCREISETMGLSRSYVSALCADPTGEKQFERRKRYQRPCPGCGRLMSGSNGANNPRSPKRCSECQHRYEREHAVWTRESVVEAIRAYAARYGRPPGAMEWSPGHARAHFRDDLADRFYEDGGWPPTSAVQKVFGGSWNAAIAAAGFAPLAPGHKYVDLEAAT